MFQKNKITKTKQSVLLVVISLFSFSCSDVFLDIDPENGVSDADAIVDIKTANAALNGAYSRFQSADYYGGGGFVSAIYLAGDNVSWVGSLNYYRDFNTHEYLADNTTIEASWNAIYAAINAANQVIDKVAVLENISETNKKRITGEALFLRALAHFDLARTWGNVPVILNATQTAGDFIGIKQSTQSEVYQQVVKDLEQALELLPSTLSRTYATTASANALLARVSLYRGDWDAAEKYATYLIEDTNYELIDYPSFFQEKESKESILELRYTSSDSNTHWHYWFSPDEGGRHEWQPAIALVELLNDPEIGGTRKSLVKDASTANSPNYFVGLLYHRTNGDDPAYLFRISEQYLIRAEARAKKANPVLADVLADLNAVKARAQARLSTAISIEQALWDIERERRVEFAFEPHRWYDLVRTERAGEVLGVTNTNKWIFPLPYNDLQADKDLTQNQGY